MANEKTEIENLVSASAPLFKAFLQFLRDMWGIRDPVEVLKECIKHNEWFKGIVLSTAFFEGIGKELLIVHFGDRINSDRIEHLRLEQIIMFLNASEMIDQTTYSDMMEVRDYRNSIVHLEPFTKPKIQPQETKRVIQKAIKCLKSLTEKWATNKKTEFIILPPKPKEKKKQ